MHNPLPKIILFFISTAMGLFSFAGTINGSVNFGEGGNSVLGSKGGSGDYIIKFKNKNISITQCLRKNNILKAHEFLKKPLKIKDSFIYYGNHKIPLNDCLQNMPL